MDLNLFYSIIAGAAGTLLGLLFVAVQPNIDRLSGYPHQRWKALAVATFYSYLLLLLMALFTLVPVLRAQAIIVCSAIGVVRQFRLWLPVWRLTDQGQFERIRETFWLLLGPVLTYAALIYFSILLLQGINNVGLEANIAVAFIFLLALVLRNSWRLLIDIPSEQKRDG